MGHRRRVADERLDAAQALRQAEKLRPREEPLGRVRPPLQPHRDHPAEVSHLAASHGVPGVVGEAGVENLLDGRLLRQPDGQLGRVVAVSVHPDRERLQPAECQVAVERPGDAAGRVLVELDRVEQVLWPDHRPADHVRVPAEVLRRRVDDDVGPELDRLLEVGRRERVIDGQLGPVLVGDLGDGRDVEDLQERVGRRFDPDELGLRRDEGLERGGGHFVRVLRREPQGLNTLSRSRNVPPYRSADATTSSPGFNSPANTAVVAARPDAKASPRSPSSRAARQVSRAVRVGLPEREYSYPLWSPGAAWV